MRALFLVHGHPAIAPGGTEALARGLFRELRGAHGVEGLLLAACDPARRAPLPGTLLQPVGGAAPDDEMLVSLGGFDRFHLSQPDAVGLVATLGPLLERLRPEVIHLHHLLGWGVETLDLLRRLAPRAAIVMTLHDYFALCPREGTLLTAELRPCHGPSTDGCRRCLPEREAGEIALRRTHLAGALRGVDRFVAPSGFLRGRFVAAGFDPVRIALIRNAVEAGPAAPHRPAPDGRRDRFGYFGQINRFKGALVALGASARLSARGVAHRLALHGPGAPTEPFAAEFSSAIAAAPAARRHGIYDPAELPRLMEAADWVVMPSLWWENAPLVLLEAARHRRPVICSGIGGMAELVEHGATGLHAPAGDPEALAEAMADGIATPGLWQRLADRITPPRGLDALAAEHMDIYRAALAGRAPRRRAA